MKDINILPRVRMMSSLCFGPQNTHLKYSHLFQEHLYIKVYWRPSHQRTSYVWISEMTGKIWWFRNFGQQWEHEKLVVLTVSLLSGCQVADTCLLHLLLFFTFFFFKYVRVLTYACLLNYPVFTLTTKLVITVHYVHALMLFNICIIPKYQAIGIIRPPRSVLS